MNVKKTDLLMNRGVTRNFLSTGSGRGSLLLELGVLVLEEEPPLLLLSRLFLECLLEASLSGSEASVADLF